MDSHYLTANPPHNDEEESDESQSDSSSDSESDTPLKTRFPTSEVCTSIPLDNIFQKQASSSRQNLPPGELAGRQHLAVLEEVSISKSHKKKRKSSQPGDSTSTLSKKHKRGGNVGEPVVEECAHGQTMLGASNGGRATVLSSLLVRIPLVDLVDLRVPDSAQQQLEKPKATVEPIVRNPTTSRTPNRRNTADMMETEDQLNRDRYPRLLDEYTGPVHDYGGRARSHGEGRWEREASRDHTTYGMMSRASGRSSDYGRGHGWEREHYRGSAGGEDYWSDVSHYESTRESQRGRGYSRYPSERKRDPEYFMQEARRRKKEADKIMVRSVSH